MDTAFLKLEDKLDQRAPATSCCGKLSLKQGVSLGCAYYICRMLINVAFPFVMGGGQPPHVCVFAHPDPGCPNFCSGEGSMFGDQLACSAPPDGTCAVGTCMMGDLPPGQACPGTIPACNGGDHGVCPPCYVQHMQQILMNPSGCESHGGTFEQVAPSKDNPAGLETMVHLLLISLSQLVVGVLAVLACKSVSNDEVDKLRALFRAIVVLVIVEAITQVISFFAVYSSCKDESYSAADGQGMHDVMRCTMTPAGDKMSYDPAGHQTSCETAHIFKDPMNSVIIFLLQVALNCYFAWVLFSYEKELRLEAAGGDAADDVAMD